MAVKPKSKSVKQLTQQQIKQELWLRGNLSWKLRTYQIPIYNAIRSSTNIQFMLNCSRRLGKTTILIIIAIEEALRTKRGLYQFTTYTGKASRGIVRPIFDQLIEDCPGVISPVWKAQDEYYYFPHTHSEIHLAGANNGHEDDSRGRRRNKCFVDEGQQIDNLEYLINSVLMPQTIDQQGGQVIIAGTPPESPAHYYKKLYHKLKLRSAVQEFDVYHNSTLTEETLEQYAKESGGYDSTAFKREYLVQFVAEEDRAIIKKWNPEKHVVIREKTPLYPFYQKYVSMDIGGKHLTAILFAYYDYRNALVYVEDEWHMRGSRMTTSIVNEQVREKERMLWEGDKPYMRVADNNNTIMLNDLNIQYDLSFTPTSKDNLHAMVNKVNIWIESGRVQVHPRCSMLIESLSAGIWNKQFDKFDYMSDFGHFDMVAALVYLIRNIDEHSNPIPAHLGKYEDKYFIPEQVRATPESSSRQNLRTFITRRNNMF